MADQTTLLYWTDEESGRLEFVEFDAVTGLSPEDTSTVTRRPVERGVKISDHVRDEPGFLSIEGWVSRTPNVAVDDDVTAGPLDLTVFARPAGGTTTIDLDVPSPPIQPDAMGLVSAGVSALGNAVFGGPTATVNAPAETKEFHLQALVLQQRSPRDRIRDVYDKLLRAKAQRALLTVLSRDRDFTDRILTRVAAPRTNQSGATKFEIDLEQLVVADTETVQSPQPLEARAAAAKNKGSQTTTDTDPEKAEKVDTVLGSATGGGGGAGESVF